MYGAFLHNTTKQGELRRSLNVATGTLTKFALSKCKHLGLSQWWGGVSLLSSRTPTRLERAQIFIVLENGIVLSVLLRVFSETFATVKNPS